MDVVLDRFQCQEVTGAVRMNHERGGIVHSMQTFGNKYLSQKFMGRAAALPWLPFRNPARQELYGDSKSYRQ